MLPASLGRAFMRFGRAFLILATLILVAACATGLMDRSPLRVLFIGNSLTYVGNLPAVFDAIASRSDNPTHSKMLVAGGATLSQRIADGSAERALSEGAYDIVVLQERGGDYIGGYGPDSRKQTDAENALRRLTSLARRFSVKPVLLGSYQKDPHFSQAIVDAESSVALKNSMPYVPVSDGFLRATTEFPLDSWLYADGMHPGHDLALLEAVRLYQILFDALPHPGEIVISAPMYPPSAHFPVAVVDGGYFEPANQRVAQGHGYSSETVSRVIKLAERNH